MTQDAPYADLAIPNAPFFAFDDRIQLATARTTGISGLYGQFDACGTTGVATITLTLGGLLALRAVRQRRRG